MSYMFLLASAGGFILIMAPFAIAAVLGEIGKKEASTVIYCLGLAIYCFAIWTATDNEMQLIIAIIPWFAGLELGFFLLDAFMGIEWERTQACFRGYNCDAL